MDRYHIGCLSYADDPRTTALLGSAISLPGLLLVALLLLPAVHIIAHKRSTRSARMTQARAREGASGGRGRVDRPRAFNSGRPFSSTRPHRYEYDVDALNASETVCDTGSFSGGVTDCTRPESHGYTRDMDEFGDGD